jgi:hypothetical protein
MINLSLGDISISSIGHSSGFFIGKKNTHKKFRSENVIDEVIGKLSGKENTLNYNCWVKNKMKDD